VRTQLNTADITGCSILASTLDRLPIHHKCTQAYAIQVVSDAGNVRSDRRPVCPADTVESVCTKSALGLRRCDQTSDRLTSGVRILNSCVYVGRFSRRRPSAMKL